MTKAKQKPKKPDKGKEEPPTSVENKVVDASESNGATNPTEIFHTPQVSQNLRNNAKPWFQTEILSMM